MLRVREAALPHTGGHWRPIGILAVTQVLSWGALYYAFGVLSPHVQRDLGLGVEQAFGAYSWSLLVAGLAATPAGMLLDRFGGRFVMAAGSLLAALGMASLARSTGLASYYLAWTLIGLAMALTLYEAAFATLNRKLAVDARRAISKLTLFGGFASTVFWPLTLKLDAALGWRATYEWYALLQVAVCLPLHLWLGGDPPRHAAAAGHGPRSHTLAEAVRHPAFWKLALAFAANTLVFSAMAVHLIPLLQRFGHPAQVAVLLAALMGPMQVAGRIGEMSLGRNVAPQVVGKFVFASLPAALAVLALWGSQVWSAALFCVLYGLSNGILTIVRGTLPQALFGPRDYGAISGALAGPSLLAKAAGPLLAAAVLKAWVTPLVLVAGMLGVAVLSLGCYLAAVRAAGEPAFARAAPG